MEKTPEKLQLKCEVGLVGGISLIAGVMIGSGIFMSPQTVLINIGSPGASLVVWAACGLLAVLASLSYAELGTVIRESGGEYIYILRTSGPVMAFVMAYTSVLVVRPTGLAGVALSFSQITLAAVYKECPPPEVLVKCLAAVAILLLTLVNCLNVRYSMSFLVFFTTIKLIALLMIVIGGAVVLSNGSTSGLQYSFEGTNEGVSNIVLAFYQCLWSFDGWNNLNYVTEELKRPEDLSIHIVWRTADNSSATIKKLQLQAAKPEREQCSGIVETSITMKTIEDEGLNLKRELGLISAISLIGGTMIGSGIFMSPQFVLANMGSSGASLVIWAVCGLTAMFGALSYAELGGIIRESGGEYIYILRVCGQLPAFFVAFAFVLVVKPFGLAAIALAIAEYAVAPFYGGCPLPPLAVKCVAAACILVVVSTNILNVRFAMAVQVVFMVAKVIGLMVIVIGGVVMFANGEFGSLATVDTAFQGTNLRINTIGVALYQGLWSYAGWYNLNYVTEELKNPEVNLPRAVMIAIPMVTILYLLVNISYLAVMTPREMISSSAVAVTWGNKVLGEWGWLMSIAAALSAFGSLNGSFFSGGRLCFVAAREGHMPDILAMAHIRRLTPSPALIFTSAISLLVLIPGDFQGIVNFFSFTAWLFYGITLSGLLYLKIKKPDLPRAYKVPIVIPIFVLLVAVFLVLAPIIDDPKIEYLYVILFILSGALVYIPFIHFKLCPGVLDKLTVFLQLLLEVSPADKNV